MSENALLATLNLRVSRGGVVSNWTIGLFGRYRLRSLVPGVFSISNMAAAGKKTLALSRNHVTDLSTGRGIFFQNGGHDKECEDLGTRSWKQNGGKGELNHGLQCA